MAKKSTAVAEKEKLPVVATQVKKAMARRIEQIAEARGRSRSKVIEKALDRLIADEDAGKIDWSVA